MAKTLDVYTMVPAAYNASSYYRILVAAETARDLGLPVRIIMDSNTAGVDPQWRVTNLCESDVILWYHPVGDGVTANARMVKSFLPSKREGEWKYPPSIVIETDDNLFNVSPHNPAFKTLGIRDQNGQEIPNGSTIGAVENGEKKVMYQDGEKGFSLANNRHTLETYKILLESADGISCTTPRVEEYVREYSSPRQTKVFPNLVRLDHYPQVDLVQDTSKINILWQGGASHYEDWYPLRNVLGALTSKYPQIHWIIWGQMYHWATTLIPPDRYTFINWCDYREYKIRLCTMNHDINLAPLSDNRFNRCRSAIKWYESSVLKKPAATLAEATGPYLDEIQDGENGLLFSGGQQFFDKLSLLIEDATERKRLAANAKDWVVENRNAMREVPKYFKWLESLRETAQRDHPHMPDSQWEAFVKEMEAEEQKEMQEPSPAVV